jgi:hypothetical protein
MPQKSDTIWGIFMNKKEVFHQNLKLEQVLKYINDH